MKAAFKQPKDTGSHVLLLAHRDVVQNNCLTDTMS